MKRYTIFVLFAALMIAAGSAFAQGDTGENDITIQPFFRVQKNGMDAQRSPGTQALDFGGTNFIHNIAQIDNTTNTLEVGSLRGLGWAWFHNATTITNAGAHGDIQLGYTNGATLYPFVVIGTNEWAGPFRINSDNISCVSSSGTNTLEYFVTEK